VPLAAASAALAPSAGGVPLPEGWIGTTDQWTQGLGIALAVLNIVVLLVAWRRLKHVQSIRGVVGTLFFGLAVLPVVVMFFGYTQGMSGMESVRACGGCHTMTSHVQDLRDLKSESLAAVHYKNRYILADQCYTCHSDYGMFGTVSAKMEGLGHVYHNITNSYEKPIKIRKPFSNTRCFGCHFGAQNFLAKHDKDMIPDLVSGKNSCLDCHGPAHHANEAAAEKQAAK